MNDHCTREEILEGARAGKLRRNQARDHLQGCNECRAFWELACLFSGASGDPLAQAPTGWIEHAAALARTPGRAKRAAQAMGRLVFDSWAAPATAGLRGQSEHDTRRLAWESEDWSVELRAESVPEGWEVVAQVSRDGHPQRGIELTFGSERVHTDISGMAVWSGRRPPRTIGVHTADGDMKLERVKWTPPGA